MREESRTSMNDGRLIIKLKLLGADFESLHQLAEYLSNYLSQNQPDCKFKVNYNDKLSMATPGVMDKNDVHQFLAWWSGVEVGLRNVKNSLDLVCDSYTDYNLKNLSDVLLELREKLLSLDCKYLPTRMRESNTWTYIDRLLMLKNPNNPQSISMLVANYIYRDKFKSPKRWLMNSMLRSVGTGFGVAFPFFMVGIILYAYSPIPSDAAILLGIGAGIILLGALIGCIVGCCQVSYECAEYNKIFSHENLKTFNNTNIFGQLLSANSVPTPGSDLGMEAAPVVTIPEATIPEATIVEVVREATIVEVVRAELCGRGMGQG